MTPPLFGLTAMVRVLRSKTVSLLSPPIASTTRFEFDLLRLPEELICLVIENVDEMKSLERLSRTCHQLQRLAEPKLYRYLTLRSGYEGDIVRHSLDMLPARESHIHTLAYLMNTEFEQSFECLHDLLTRCTKLKEFSYESPECNGSVGSFEDEDDWMNMTDWLFQPFENATTLQHPPVELNSMPLQMLRKLTLHMNGIESPYWNFDSRSRSIFLLPALQYLKISCVNILDDVAEGIDRVSFSPLKYLYLEECNFTHKGLHDVLSFPMALEKLTLMENVHNVRHFAEALHPSWNQLFENNPSATLAALSQQKDSLVALTYATSDQSWDGIPTFISPDKTPIDGGFADFFALEEIKLVGQCFSFERAVLSSKAPPNLRILAADSEYAPSQPRSKMKPLDGAYESTLESVPFFRAPSSCMPRDLKLLQLTYTFLPTGFNSLTLTMAKELRKAGVWLKINIKQPDNFFPPFLDGEDEPHERVYFDGLEFVEQNA